jgi:hypothetical protein
MIMCSRLRPGGRLVAPFIMAMNATMPGLGTVSGTTATVLMMGGIWGGHYGARTSILPRLIQCRDQLRTDEQLRCPRSAEMDGGVLIPVDSRVPKGVSSARPPWLILCDRRRIKGRVEITHLSAIHLAQHLAKGAVKIHLRLFVQRAILLHV